MGCRVGCPTRSDVNGRRTTRPPVYTAAIHGPPAEAALGMIAAMTVVMTWARPSHAALSSSRLSRTSTALGDLDLL